MLAAHDFDFICRLVRERAAIVLEPGKEYLAQSRLEPVAKEAGLGSVTELVAALRTGTSRGLHDKVIDAMTTNETSFFRDNHPYESLRKSILPEIIERNASRRSLDIWCCASSTGQEPYSVALTIKEHFPELSTWRVNIRATDISPSALDKARSGRFSQLEVNRGLPVTLLVKWFTRQGAFWEIDPSIRSLVSFELQNLAAPWMATMPYDLVLLRNVLIYFDLETKRQILGQVRKVLRPGGYLLLGGSETTLAIDNNYERVTMDRTGWHRPIK
ncbi:MAG: protein-glutamate O-methyltransferase CheR [Actinomycetota bacterium]|nr:protein-glutamate O-methyltransferase CheR [Actinomycetota bacterium]